MLLEPSLIPVLMLVLLLTVLPLLMIVLVVTLLLLLMLVLLFTVLLFEVIDVEPPAAAPAKQSSNKAESRNFICVSLKKKGRIAPFLLQGRFRPQLHD